MVGRKKAASTAKGSSSKQQTITDLFSKKSAPLPVPHAIASPPPVPPPIRELDAQTSIAAPSTQPVASTSKTAEIIDIAESPPPLKPPSPRKESNKPLSSRSNKPPSGLTRPPPVIDLTSRSESPPTLPPQTQASKPTYSIFAPRPKLDGASVPPIPHPTYSIFNVKPKNPPGPVLPTKSLTAVKESDAPFPSKDDQHIRGPQSAFLTSAYPKRSDTRTQHPMDRFQVPIRTDEISTQRTLTRQTASILEKEECLESIPSDHKRDHPAIARLSAAITPLPDASSSAEKLWSERWRPRRADEVLGNEQNALYLRDWLRALEVRFEVPASLDSGENSRREEPRGVKRPQVMRTVTRARKRRQQSSDSWIVSDASDYSSDVEMAVDPEGGDDDDEYRPTPVAEGASAPNSFRDHLANTILLTGPSGSGKTTAVYSCAEELGWEVFEVYPGIGKRNGASLESLIGEVGKNHLVRRTRRGRDEETEPDTDFGFVTPNVKAQTRQSVILLEEVDILFQADGNFWPAVIRLCRDSKRAIICTCNDLSLVPTSELPLQKILEFQPCVPDVAGSYLQGLCCLEGYLVKREVLSQMYGHGRDLRHTILRLQLLCQGFPLGTRPELDHLLDWNVASRQSVPHADLISFVDAYMTRDSLDQPEALALTRYMPSVDDEIGYPILADALNDGYGIYDWDTKIIAAVIELSRGRRVTEDSWSSARESYQAFLDALSPCLPVGQLGQPATHVDFVPFVRQIIAGEDALEAVYRQMRTRGLARTYYRSLVVGEETRRALNSSSL
ncbi:P-loop containing nucleoside triphosphate hydrolase protein [Mycena filopes]|nr:P-loop containing nucleoside triphosphate hydrolase protein [Mycena filopes]